MNDILYKLKFRNIILFIAFIYGIVFFANGDFFTRLPTNWFTMWLGNIFSLMDKEGFFNVWTGQTQGVHYLYFLLWKPAQLISHGEWYHSAVFSGLWYVVTIISLFSSVFLFYKISEVVWNEKKAILVSTIFLLLILTFEWYVVIDFLAIAVMFGSIYCFLKSKTRTSGILMGISLAIKPLGIAFFPVMLKSEFLPTKERLKAVVISGVTLVILLLPFMIGNFQIFLSSFNWQSGRPPWETFYSFIMWVSHQPFPTSPFFMDYSGIMPRDWGWTGITPVPSMMTTPVPDFKSWYNLVFMLTLSVSAIVFLILKRIPGREDFLRGGLLALCIYFTLFYGWSIQFYLWFAPFLLAFFPLRIAFVLRILIILEYPLFYGLYLAHIAPDIVTSVAGMPTSMTAIMSRIGVPGFWLLVFTRTAFLLTLAIIVWRKLPSHIWNPVSVFHDFYIRNQKWSTLFLRIFKSNQREL